MKKTWSIYLKEAALALSLGASAFLVILWIADLAFPIRVDQVDYGITFSMSYAEELGFAPQSLFLTMIDDLGAKKIRLPIYWNLVAEKKGEYDFSRIDALLKLAREKRIQLILVLGYKVPRWPECYPPGWAKNFTKTQTQIAILDLIKNSVDHFKSRPEIIAWQIENEPLFQFGLCQMMDRKFLLEEVKLVRSLDKRPVIITDAGELSMWVDAMQLSDTMGTTLYRTVWDPRFGFFRYPLPPSFYWLKGMLIQKLFAPNSSGMLISELQAEPWAPGKPLLQIPLPQQIKLFDLRQFQDNIDYARKTGIKEQYLWGAEWWYWMKTKGHPEYWEYAKTLF